MEMDGVLAIAGEALDELITRHDTETRLSGLESQLQAKEKFLSLVSHDLRTPLTAAKISAQMIARAPERPGVGASAVRIAECLDRADRMIVNLLDANRLRAGMGIPVQRAECELRELLLEVVEDLTFLHQGRCQLNLDQKVTGFFDSQSIRRAVENLIGNAVKYGFENTPIRVELRQESDAARISVHNLGNPIAADEQATIFSWYGRTASARSSKSGWGLGLMLVKGIAEAHGGRILLESTADDGTTFTLVLPLDSART